MEKLLNSLATKTMIGGTDKGINKIFDLNIPLSNTFYWDDTTNTREGFSIKFPIHVCITRIEVYATDRWALGDVRLEIDNNAIYRQNVVSGSKPLIYNKNIVTNTIDIVRYTVQDSVISKILIYGHELKFLIKEKDNYYSIDKENYNTETKMFNPINIKNLKEDIVTLGFDNLSKLSTDITINEETFKPLDKFNSFKILCIDSYNISIHGNKSNQELIIANDSILTRMSKHIDYFKLEDSSNDIKIIFSINNGITWKSYKDNNFIDLNIYEGFNNSDLNKSIDIIKERGINSNILYTIDFNTLNIEKIKFAYLIISNNCYMKRLDWQFDSKGIMELCDKSDVKIQLYYGGVKLISNIDINILKTNITYEGFITN